MSPATVGSPHPTRNDGRHTMTQAARLRDLLRRAGLDVAAAAAARRSADFVVIARTDARAVAGFDEAVARANAAFDAGADMAFVEAPQTLEEVAQVPLLVRGPCLLNVVRGGKTPDIDLGDA